MRYLSFLFVTFIALLLLSCKLDKSGQFAANGPKILWDDSMIKLLPSDLDTTIIVFDANNKPLKFREYIKPVFDNVAVIYTEDGKWRLQRFTKTGLDSLNKDDLAPGRSNRFIAFKHPDTSNNVKDKLRKIANTLSMADYILVVKSTRKMYVKRKGVDVLKFNINLGGRPLGNKEFEGDRKTPEGIYHLDMKFERVDKFYKSFFISYPNASDKQRAMKKGLKPGSNVLIHGTSPERLYSKDWTNGCIALKNDEMDSLFNYVMDGTLIEIRK
ncbi:murein L,D-transpeptidase family protein [Pedobacter sp. Leaf176]|uniref:L,D-transpeptidase family protein n=1 Tax=Pedobacter sp. Leaf176 TaxID=1736286 RepID=UPI000A5C0774|nr:L,D-transpeptidase family protein [Pedobacter sp. Leaf176]